MLEAADQALVNDLAGAPSLKQRRALAKIITLLESTRLDHRHRADDVNHFASVSQVFQVLVSRP